MDSLLKDAIADAKTVRETALENDYVTSDEGKKIQVSVCPNGHGKIKSPTCCGADMDCKG